MIEQSDIKIEFIGDHLEGSIDYFVTETQPDLKKNILTLEKIGFPFGSGRRVTLTTNAAEGDNNRCIEIIGIDAYGNSIVDTIMAPTTASTVTGETYFREIESISAYSAKEPVGWAGSITVGMAVEGGKVVQSVGGGGRVVLKGYSITSGGTPDVPVDYAVEFREGTEKSEVIFKAQLDPVANTTVDYTVPNEGVVFEGGLVITYDFESPFNMMNIFYS